MDWTTQLLEQLTFHWEHQARPRLDGLGDEEYLWARPCGPAEGPFADLPMAALILHIHREAIHHLAEVALLRDLYAHGAAG